MSSDYEFKVVKVMRNNHRSRQRALRREAKDGWEVVETARGAALSRLDHVTLRRPRSYKAEMKAERRAQKAETVARYAERKAARTAATSGPHEHLWADRTTDDDRKNSVEFLVCTVCGKGRTLGG